MKRELCQDFGQNGSFFGLQRDGIGILRSMEVGVTAFPIMAITAGFRSSERRSAAFGLTG